MSSLAVRQHVENWLQDAAMTVPFYGTVNVDQDPRDDIWMTVMFSANYREVLTYCEGIEEEEGEIELVYFGEPGTGYQALLTALEGDVATFMAQKDPSHKLTLKSRSAPYEWSGGSSERHYALSVFIEYSYYP